MAIYNYSEVNAEENGFTFKTTPTKQQTEKFEYVAFDYFSNNPGTVSNQFESVVGIYYEPTTGEAT